MPGMRMSVTTTSQGSARSASSAACALPTNVICHSLRLGRSMRFRPSSTRGSSSTKMTRIAFKQRLRPPAPLRLRAADGQADGERGARAGAARHLDGAAVLVDDHVVRDGQALARALADFLGREERLEDALLHVRRHSGARVADLDDREFAVGPRAHADLALALAAVADHVGDGMRGIHDDVEHDLVELGRRAMHRGQVRCRDPFRSRRRISTRCWQR